jgi:choline monooxygenase
MMRRVVVFETQRALAEDAAILSDVQQGLEASPHRGVIGTREERVHAFQKYVKMKLAKK